MNSTARLLFFTAVCFLFGFFLQGWLSALCALPILWDLAQTWQAGRNDDTTKKLSARIDELNTRVNNLASNMSPRGF